MPRIAAHTLSIIIFSLLLQGCSPGPSAEEAASEMVAAMNAGDAEKLWGLVSFESRGALSEQLSNNKKNAPGRRLLKDYLGLSDAEIENLGVEDYFALIMKSDPNFGVRQVEIVGVDVNGDTAKIYYKGGGIEGVAPLVKEQGRWKMIMDMP